MKRNKGKDKAIDKEIEKLEKEKDFVKKVLREKQLKRRRIIKSGQIHPGGKN